MRDVAGGGEGAAARLLDPFDDGVQALGAARREDDARTSFRERERRRLADTGRRAGDDDHGSLDAQEGPPRTMVVPWTLSEPTPGVCRCSTSAGRRVPTRARSWRAHWWRAGWPVRRVTRTTTCSGTSGCSSTTIPTSSSGSRTCPSRSGSRTSSGSSAKRPACRSTRSRPRDRPTSTPGPCWTPVSGWGSGWRPAARRGERVLFATGHPGDLDPLYGSIAELAAARGARIVRPGRRHLLERPRRGSSVDDRCSTERSGWWPTRSGPDTRTARTRWSVDARPPSDPTSWSPTTGSRERRSKQASRRSRSRT